MNQQFAVGRQRLLGHLAGLLFSMLIAGSFSLGALAAPYLSPAALNAVRFVLATAVMLAVYLAVYLTPAFVIIIEGVVGHGWANASTFVGAFVVAFALLIMALAPDQ